MNDYDEFDVTAIGNAIVDVIAQADDVVAGRAQPAEGRDEPDRRRDGRESSTASWAPGKEASGGSAETPLRASRRSAARPHTRQGRGRPARQGLHARHPRGWRHLRHRAAGRRAADGTQPDLRDARRAADHADLPRRLHARWVPRTSTWTTPQHRQGGLPGGLPLGSIRAPRRRCSPRQSRRKEAGVKVSLTLSDAFCVGRFRDEFLELAEKTWTSCSPTRARSCRCTRPTTSIRRCSRSEITARLPR